MVSVFIEQPLSESLVIVGRDIFTAEVNFTDNQSRILTFSLTLLSIDDAILDGTLVAVAHVIRKCRVDQRVPENSDPGVVN